MRPNGFTLIETMVVVTMAGLILAIGMPRLITMRRGMQLDAAAQQLAGDLRRVQVEAVKRNRSLRFHRTGTTSYSIDSLGSHSLTGDVTFALGASDSVRMASFGPPIGGGAVFPLVLGSKQKTVRVSAVGMVSVQ